MEITRARLAAKYILFEMLPVFLLGIGIFIFIILMFQSFRLTEYIVVHGAKVSEVAFILGYLAISFLPVILPMSLLFAVLLTYGRLSADSEIVAFRSIGLSLGAIGSPAIILAVLTTIMSAQTSFYLAPWGNRQMEVKLHEIGSSKPGVTIREGVFSEGFFDLVVYANEVDSDSGMLRRVFIYDERDPNSPLTIIARKGQLVSDEALPGQKAFLRLINGNIHKTSKEVYTKVDFDTYDISLFDPVNVGSKKKTPLSYNLRELRAALSDKTLPKKLSTQLRSEYHRRWAISFACIVFALLGVGLGVGGNRRSGKSAGFILCVGIVVLYWIVYATFESLAKSGTLPIFPAIWATNILFGAYGLWTLRKAHS